MMIIKSICYSKANNIVLSISIFVNAVVEIKNTNIITCNPCALLMTATVPTHQFKM